MWCVPLDMGRESLNLGQRNKVQSRFRVMVEISFVIYSMLVPLDRGNSEKPKFSGLIHLDSFEAPHLGIYRDSGHRYLES